MIDRGEANTFARLLFGAQSKLEEIKKVHDIAVLNGTVQDYLDVYEKRLDDVAALIAKAHDKAAEMRGVIEKEEN